MIERVVQVNRCTLWAEKWSRWRVNTWWSSWPGSAWHPATKRPKIPPYRPISVFVTKRYDVPYNWGWACSCPSFLPVQQVFLGPHLPFSAGSVTDCDTERSGEV